LHKASLPGVDDTGQAGFIFSLFRLNFVKATDPYLPCG
jgi:hypothetical protein